MTNKTIGASIAGTAAAVIGFIALKNYKERLMAKDTQVKGQKAGFERKAAAAQAAARKKQTAESQGVDPKTVVDEDGGSDLARMDGEPKDLEQAYNDDNRTPTGVKVTPVTDKFEGHHTMDEGVDVQAERIDPAHIRNASHEAVDNIDDDQDDKH